MECPNSASLLPTNFDSEREEGEIVDDVDDLSDISSEEEFLLRERLQVLENYNNVLERKQAKDLTLNPSKKINTEISPKNSKFCDKSGIYNNYTIKKHIKPLNKYRKKDAHTFDKNKNNKKKPHHSKKKLPVQVISESSEESDEENKVKRRKLENAVIVNRLKNDSSSLKSRLTKMLCSSQQTDADFIDNITQKTEHIESPIISIDTVDSINITAGNTTVIDHSSSQTTEIVDLTMSHNNTDSVNGILVVNQVICEKNEIETVDKKFETIPESNNNLNLDNSDEDLELLRQNALQTKNTVKCLNENKSTENISNDLENKPISEEEDSDTAELRMICLKSALLKRAIENKKKEKLRKRLSSSLHESFLVDDATKDDAENNTDIESVDMDIGSDGEDKCKENVIIENASSNIEKNSTLSTAKEDEPDEDEDLLRAKLLTSLSKNLPNLVDPLIIDDSGSEKSKIMHNVKKLQVNPSNEKKFIIKIGDSDSEGEHEATKNLTKMHIKLTEQVEFEQKLDLFLKSTRLEVENQKKLPDVVQEPSIVKSVEKFVPKTVKHLPKSEQIEYKNLVKRMAELEKIKKARQASIHNMKNASVLPLKETLKPRNVTVDSKLSAYNNIDEQIALSRKNIATESSSIMKLKEEGIKLSQKYKIVVTELKNITTAISLNNKQQRAAQTRLARIRAQHQLLLKSTSMQHSKANYFLPPLNKNIVTRLQKENNPKKEEHKNQNLLKSVKVSVVNDLSEDVISAKHSIQIDVTDNKKTVKLSPIKDRTVGIQSCGDIDNNKDCVLTNDTSRLHHVVDKEKKEMRNDDYTSPLQALQSATWQEDPNAVLCPFDIGGNCKDSDCKFLHPKKPSVQ